VNATGGGRYSVAGAAEARFEPGSRGRVLANRLGIVRVRDMQQAESVALLATTDALLDEVAQDQTFTSDDLARWHRRWLGGIYPWAGEWRRVNIGKGGFQFASAHLVPGLMADFERDVLKHETPCTGMDEARLVTALARSHAEFILIHPFREGNGRLARLLNTLMALQAGMPALDYGVIRGAAKRRYIAAIHAALAGDYGPMETVFRAVLRRTLRGVRA
jgi:cell filamentation protein